MDHLCRRLGSFLSDESIGRISCRFRHLQAKIDLDIGFMHK